MKLRRQKDVFGGLARSTGLTLCIRLQKTGHVNLHKHLDHFMSQMGLSQINNPLDPAGLLLIYRTRLQS